jgi:hypothetical protein
MESIGKAFENRIEEMLLSTMMFSDDVFNPDKSFINVFNYTEFRKRYSNFQSRCFEEVICDNQNQIFLFKNFPHGNDKDENTEFCIIQKVGDKHIKFRIECKFQGGAGSSHQKIADSIDEYRDFKTVTNESYYVIVYDGDFFMSKPKIINNVLRKIRFDFDILFLSLSEFESFLNEYSSTQDPKSAFKNHHNSLI